jgi:hypothetical protein
LKLIKLPFTFSSLIAVKTKNIRNVRPTWKWAGYLYEPIETPLGLTRVEQRLPIPIDIPVVFHSSRLTQNFKLEFEKQEWINSLQLSIYQSNMPTEFEPQQQSNKGSTTGGTPINTSAISVTLLAANPDRKSLRIVNTSNRDLYVHLGATASLAAYTSKLPKLAANGIASAFDDDTYTGVVSGIWESAGSGSAQVIEVLP